MSRDIKYIGMDVHKEADVEVIQRSKCGILKRHQ